MGVSVAVRVDPLHVDDPPGGTAATGHTRRATGPHDALGRRPLVLGRPGWPLTLPLTATDEQDECQSSRREMPDATHDRQWKQQLDETPILDLKPVLSADVTER